ncbi:MAG: hypothetical protein MUO63_18035 [Desulfobulbaceae bacterium]|nr:hypothetical protein [Desulfobulbaceae bacterium]
MSLSLADLFNKTTAVRTPALMFQGTCSNAGKSILTAALCRILLQDGLSVILPGSKNVATDLV